MEAESGQSHAVRRTMDHAPRPCTTPMQHPASVKHLLEAVLVQGRPPVGPLVGRLLHLEGVQRVPQLLLQLLELSLQGGASSDKLGRKVQTTVAASGK